MVVIIDSRDTLFGYPILDIRELVRSIGDRLYDETDLHQLISEILEVSIPEAEAIFYDLCTTGYLERKEVYERQFWVTSIKGNALAMASAAKPILRKTADKKLHEFMDRVKEVNANGYYLYMVKRVIVFGSYLSSKERLGDIDIAVELVPKEKNPKLHGELTRERARKARKEGRAFRNFIDELYWARTEVQLFLKSRSRSISLHETDDPILEQVVYQVVFEA